MTLNELAKEVHANAVAHGWWTPEPSFGEIVALCHSELSEALQAYRDGERLVDGACTAGAGCCRHWDICDSAGHPEGFKGNPDTACKPEGIAVEMVDCLLRILDWLATTGVDIDKLAEAKHEYNKTRPFRHGDKRL